MLRSCVSLERRSSGSKLEEWVSGKDIVPSKLLGLSFLRCSVVHISLKIISEVHLQERDHQRPPPCLRTIERLS